MSKPGNHLNYHAKKKCKVCRKAYWPFIWKGRYVSGRCEECVRLNRRRTKGGVKRELLGEVLITC